MTRGRTKPTLRPTKKVKRKSRVKPTPPTPTSVANSGRYKRGSTTISEAARATFLSVLMQGFSPLRAAMEVSHPRETFYRLRENNEQFRLAWDAAIGAGNEFLEDVARNRAVEGTKKPLAYQGELTGDYIHEYSDTLLMFTLNGRMPEKYRQNIKVDGPDLSAAYAASMAKATNGKG